MNEEDALCKVGPIVCVVLVFPNEVLNLLFFFIHQWETTAGALLDPRNDSLQLQSFTFVELAADRALD